MNVYFIFSMKGYSIVHCMLTNVLYGYNNSVSLTVMLMHYTVCLSVCLSVCLFVSVSLSLYVCRHRCAHKMIINSLQDIPPVKSSISDTSGSVAPSILNLSTAGKFPSSPSIPYPLQLTPSEPQKGHPSSRR